MVETIDFEATDTVSCFELNGVDDNFTVLPESNKYKYCYHPCFHLDCEVHPDLG